MRNKPSPADFDLAINQAKHGGWIDPTDEPDCWECLLAKPSGGAMRALWLILALVALAPQARAQPLPPDQACSEIVKTLESHHRAPGLQPGGGASRLHCLPAIPYAQLAAAVRQCDGRDRAEPARNHPL